MLKRLATPVPEDLAAQYPDLLLRPECWGRRNSHGSSRPGLAQ